MPKPLKALFIIGLLLVPYYVVFPLNLINFNLGLVNWVILIKCLKSFNIDKGDPLKNIMYTLKDLRLKKYDTKKKKELEKGFRYLSKLSQVLLMAAPYFAGLVSMIYAESKYNEILNVANISKLTGIAYFYRSLFCTLFYGIFISIMVQLFFFVMALLYIHLSQLCFFLAAFSSLISERASTFFLEFAYEVGDQRPYYQFNNPLFITDISTFWSVSWHSMLVDIFVVVPKDVYRSSGKLTKKFIAMSAFFFSGLFHDYPIIATKQEISTESIKFFGLQGLAMLFETLVFAVFPKKGNIGKYFGIVFGNLVMIYTVHIFIKPIQDMKMMDEGYFLLFELPHKLGALVK